MDTLPPEILPLFFKYARTLHELLQFSLINKMSLQAVRAHDWPEFQVVIRKSPMPNVHRFSNAFVKPTDGVNYYFLIDISSLKILDGNSDLVSDLIVNILDENKTKLQLTHFTSYNINISSDFSNMPTCQHFEFTSSPISEKSLNSIKNCQSLKISWYYDQVEPLIEFFKCHPECHTFTLHTNDFTNLSDLYPHLTNIVKLHIEQNNYFAIPVLPNCRKLTVSYRQLPLGNLIKMLDLSLKSLTITIGNRVPSQWFPHLARLKEVNIQYYIYKDEDILHLKNCETLYVDNISPNILKQLTNIKKLMIHDTLNNYNKDYPFHLIPPTIEKLKIFSSKCDFPCELVNNWPHLISLNLSEVNIIGNISALKNLHYFEYYLHDYDENNIVILRNYGVKCEGEIGKSA